MQDYTSVVIFIGVAWTIILLLRIGIWMDKAAMESMNKVVVEKACPPHNWSWEEQIGMEGTFFIRCQRCRRLPGWEDEKT